MKKASKGLALAAVIGLASQAQASTLGDIADKTVVHGYVTTDYQNGKLINDASGDNKIISDIEMYRFIIGTTSRLSENIIFNSELEIEHATRTGVKSSSTTVDADGDSTTADDQKVLTKASAGLEIELEQAWVEFQRFSAFRPRVGVVLVPVGRLNINHDADEVDSVDRPLVDRNIVPTTWFEPGAGFTGEVELGLVEVSYEAYVINGLRGSESLVADESKMRSMRMHKDSSNDNNNNKAVTGRIQVSPLMGLKLGFSGYSGKYDSSGAYGMRFGAVDAHYRWKWLDLQGEWVEVNIEKPEGWTANFAGLRQGWYAQTLVRLPVEGWGRFEPFVQLSHQDPDLGRETMNDQMRTVLGLNYRPIDNVVVKLNYATTAYDATYTDAKGAEAEVEDKRFLASVAASY